MITEKPLDFLVVLAYNLTLVNYFFIIRGFQLFEENMDGINTNQTTSNATANRAAQALVELKARVVADRVNLTSNQIDPALLARISLEEEMKRRGGGGGGGKVESFNPNLFVSYSYKIINDALRQIYEAANRALAPNQAVNQAANQVVSFAAGVTQGLNNVLSGVMTNLGNFASGLMATLTNPLATARTLMTNMMHLGTLMGNAVANGLKRIFYGKDETNVDSDNAFYVNADNMFTNFMNIFTLNDNPEKESNGKNIKSHIDNLTKQITRWVDLLTLPFENFAKRWFGRR